MKAMISIAAITLAALPCLAQSRYSISDEPANGPGSPQVVVLRDRIAGVEAAITPSQGGELSSFRVKIKGEWTEMLYRARDYSAGGGFQGKAPLLWPAVGGQYPVGSTTAVSCADGTYPLAGKTYSMPCHGFARNLPWSEVTRSAGNGGARVTVRLKDSERTRTMYPFAFLLDASYELTGGHLTINYTVTSDPSNVTPMIFSIGNHIAFKIPFVKGSDPSGMTFESPSTVQLLRNSRGVLSGEKTPRSFDSPTRLGDFDALTAVPLAGYKSQPYVRLVDQGGISLRLSQQASSVVGEPLVRFNIYGGPKVGYFSPEPWFGIQNSMNLGQGLVKLGAGESWKWRIELQADGPAPAFSVGSTGIEKVAGDFGFVEGPVWSKQGFLIFSDIYNSRIMKSAGGNRAEIYRNHSLAANGNSMDVQGRLYSAERDGRRIVRMEKDGSLTVIAAEFNGKRLNSPNDVVVRRDGHVYFSDPASKAVLEPQELGFNGLYHVTPAGKLSLITAKLPRPNGVALTPDGRTLYVADSEKRSILAYDLDSAGNAGKERVFIEGIDGSPDGLRVAANGNLYIACRGICVYAPSGKSIRTIEFPETPANCAFGDADLRTLYVTARTSVYRVRIPDTGSLQY